MARVVPLNKKVEAFVKDQLSEAKSRLAIVEAGAGKVVSEIKVRGKESQRGVESLLKRLNGKSARSLTKQAETLIDGLAERLGAIPQRIVALSGIATQDQVRAIGRDLAKVSKKLDGLSKTRSADA